MTGARTLQVGQREVIALSDGTFTMGEGFMSEPGYHLQLEADTGSFDMPIASFVVPGERMVLLDAGLGPSESPNLAGGALLDELAAIGVRPADIDVIAISHLHLDHDGWIATAEGEVVFPNATVHVGRADYEHFVLDGDAMRRSLRMAPHLRHALTGLLDGGRLVLLDDVVELVPGVVALPAPGHTPGHTIFAIRDDGEQLLVLGDAMYCPAQLTEIDLTAMHDVDPVLARRTRASIQRDMEAHGTAAIGCHFPGLQASRVLGGRAVPA